MKTTKKKLIGSPGCSCGFHLHLDPEVPKPLKEPVGQPRLIALGKVLITELSGAESVIHFAHEELSWTSQSHGVHAMQVGETATFYMDIGQCMYFDADGRLVAS